MTSPSKPKRKYTRRVKLTASEVNFAKLINKPLEEVVKDKLSKRGRPRKVNPTEVCPIVPSLGDVFKRTQGEVIINLNHQIEQYKVVIDYLETKLGLPK